MNRSLRTSLGYVRRLFASVDDEWERDRVVSGLSSGEGLIWQVRDPIETKQPVKVEGRVEDYESVIEDHGVQDKRLLAIESEFASVLRMIGREGNTLSPVVRQAWDGGTLKTLTKTSAATASGSHISIIGHITAQELKRLLNQTEAGNGFGNRFLVVCVKRSKLLPEGGHFHEEDVAPLVRRLRETVESAREVTEIHRDDEARALWRKAYPQLSAGRLGLLGAMTGRAEAQVTRLSCLFALADKSSVARVVHLEAALEVWRYCFESARFLFGETMGDADADRLHQALRQAGAKGLSQTEISHTVFQKNRTALELERILNRPQFSWTRIKGESNVQGGRGNGSVKDGEGCWVGADGGSPEGDRSPCRRGGDWGGGLGAGATMEREPQAGRRAAAVAWRVARCGVA